MNQEKCPRCSNHCEQNNLGCGRGREHFNHSKEESKSEAEEVMMYFRKCGHKLHHGEIASDEFLSSLSFDEVHTLHQLLEKVCSSFDM